MKHIVVRTKSPVNIPALKTWVSKLPESVAVEIINHNPFTIKVVPIDPDIIAATQKDSPAHNKSYLKFIKISLSKYVRDIKSLEFEIA